MGQVLPYGSPSGFLHPRYKNIIFLSYYFGSSVIYYGLWQESLLQNKRDFCYGEAGISNNN